MSLEPYPLELCSRVPLTVLYYCFQVMESTDDALHQYEPHPLLERDDLIPQVHPKLRELLILNETVYLNSWLRCDYPNLTRLELRSVSITDDDFTEICSKLPQLEWLTVCQSNVTKFNLKNLLKLQHVELDWNDTFASIHLDGLEHVRHFSIEGCRHVNHMGLKYLATHCPNIELLNISSCHNAKTKALQVVCENFPALKCLKVNEFNVDCVRALFSHIHHLQKLRHLHVEDTVDPRLEKANLATSETFSLFEKIKTLRAIYLSEDEVLHRANHCKS